MPVDGPGSSLAAPLVRHVGFSQLAGNNSITTTRYPDTPGPPANPSRQKRAHRTRSQPAGPAVPDPQCSRAVRPQRGPCSNDHHRRTAAQAKPSRRLRDRRTALGRAALRPDRPNPTRRRRPGRRGVQVLP